MQWSNYDNFVNLCESTQVVAPSIAIAQLTCVFGMLIPKDGSHGRVYYLDRALELF